MTTTNAKPKLAAFPKAYMDQLTLTGEMTLSQWFDICKDLKVDGTELYCNFKELQDPSNWSNIKNQAQDRNLPIPMLCCSPDFTHQDPGFRRQEIDNEKRMIDMAAGLGAKFCRVLSGQRRPEISREEGIRYAADCIQACIPHAAMLGIKLIIENHYKDNYWNYPEFAQKMDIFCDLIARINSPHFGVNYDPSNTFLAGEDPLELLRRVKHRVLTMHASDRYLTSGTIEDLRREEIDAVGYAKRLSHGEIGKGLNNYDAIFTELKSVNFTSWISIEDGVDGVEQLRASVAFLRKKMAQYWS